MLCDAHVHVGWFSRLGRETPFYYSPRRVAGVLARCGVERFIVSSTCAQVEGIGIADIVREAREMRRIAGGRAHVFFWLSGRLYDEDRAMRWMDSGLFDGIKLHGGETPWLLRRRADLWRVLSAAEGRAWPVMFHAGVDGGSRPEELAEVAEAFPGVRLCFAHCRPMDEMAAVVAAHPNVYTDTAYMDEVGIAALPRHDWKGRLMFGTDLPVWQAYEAVGLAERYRRCVRWFAATGIAEESAMAFRRYAGGQSAGLAAPAKGMGWRQFPFCAILEPIS